MADQQISRLRAVHAPLIVDCFRRVYGDSYANELFYDVSALARALADGRLGSVGALDPDGRIVGHMAMTLHPEAVFAELGNTVVDPAARGSGLAWRVGSELGNWCRELGYRGFLHYPTTDHHIMQRRSVERGFETGLMLGYIPAETHGGVRAAEVSLRQAATVVYEAYDASPAMDCYLPQRFAGLLAELAAPTGLIRRWLPGHPPEASASEARVTRFPKRGLVRLEVQRSCADLGSSLEVLLTAAAPCRQIDFRLDDPAVESGVEVAVAAGFRFCAWMPGYRRSDVLRLQWIDERLTDLAPRLENPVARRLLEHFRRENT